MTKSPRKMLYNSKKSQFLRKICNFIYILDEDYSVLQPALPPLRSSCLNSALYLHMCYLNYRLPHISFFKCVLLLEALTINKHLFKPSNQPFIFFFFSFFPFSHLLLSLVIPFVLFISFFLFSFFHAFSQLAK